MSETIQYVTTTAEPVTTTAEPVTTTAEPVTTTAEPITTTAEPVTTTAEPVTTTAEPITTIPEPKKIKRYFYHPDNIIYITNEEKTYFEVIKFAKFDIGSNIVIPQNGADEFEYIAGYGTKYFNRQGMISFNDEPRPDLDALIENIDFYIDKKNKRGIITDDPWNIPEEMK